jgi:TAG lipase/steryl ester hydrolase/phospholipase A2/LPA acyltransferase
MPKIICGSSAGSMICAAIATISNVELMYDWKFVFGRKPSLGYLHEDNWEMFFNMLSGNTVFKSETLKEYIYQFVEDSTFKENFEKTGWILNITVTEDSFSTSRLFNYLTTPNVLIWSAVVASCAIPGMF